MGQIATHYDNLQVARNASPEVIKAAYRSLCQRWHPDRNDAAKRAACEKAMKHINAAYAVLSDAERRREHDAWIAAQEGAQAAPPRTADRPRSRTWDDIPLRTATIEWVDLTPELRLLFKAPAGKNNPAPFAQNYSVGPYVLVLGISVFVTWLTWTVVGSERLTGSQLVAAASVVGFALAISVYVVWELVRTEGLRIRPGIGRNDTHFYEVRGDTVQLWSSLRNPTDVVG